MDIRGGDKTWEGDRDRADVPAGMCEIRRDGDGRAFGGDARAESEAEGEVRRSFADAVRGVEGEASGLREARGEDGGRGTVQREQADVLQTAAVCEGGGVFLREIFFAGRISGWTAGLEVELLAGVVVSVDSRSGDRED